LESGYVDVYVDVRHGRQPRPSMLPQADEILAETHGVIVYQEQVMRLAQTLAGFTLGQADVLRGAMGKKNAQKMAEMKVAFLDGAVARGIPQSKAAEVYESMAKFAHYGFNKSHSLAYAVVAYWTAWLKAHYPAEFMAALLTSEMGQHEKLGRFINDCRREGLAVRPPDVNFSDFPFTVVDGEIVYGLGAIKGVGQGAAEAIVAAREKEPYKDLFDFCQKIASRKITRRTAEALILSGSFDRTGIDRATLLAALPEALKGAKAGPKKKAEVGLFDLLPADKKSPPPSKYPEAEPMSQKDKLNHEKTYLGVFLSGHPLAPYEAAFRAVNATPIGQAKKCFEKKPISLAGHLTRVTHKKDKNDRPYAFATLEDLENSIELLIWNKELEKCQEFLEPEKLVYLEGTLEPGNDKFGAKVVVRDLRPLESGLKYQIRSLYIRTPPEELRQVTDFLKPLLKAKNGVGPNVWVGIVDDGEAFFQLDKTLELSPALLTSAQAAIGYFGEIHCLATAHPFESAKV
jgi:DNA polymerase-3 subunit alpha